MLLRPDRSADTLFDVLRHEDADSLITESNSCQEIREVGEVVGDETCLFLKLPSCGRLGILSENVQSPCWDLKDVTADCCPILANQNDITIDQGNDGDRSRMLDHVAVEQRTIRSLDRSLRNTEEAEVEQEITVGDSERQFFVHVTFSTAAVSA